MSLTKSIIASVVLGAFLVYSTISLITVLTIPERLSLYTYPPSSVCGLCQARRAVSDISYGFAMSSVIINFSFCLIITFLYILKKGNYPNGINRQNLEIDGQ